MEKKIKQKKLNFSSKLKQIYAQVKISFRSTFIIKVELHKLILAHGRSLISAIKDEARKLILAYNTNLIRFIFSLFTFYFSATR